MSGSHFFPARMEAVSAGVNSMDLTQESVSATYFCLKARATAGSVIIAPRPAAAIRKSRGQDRFMPDIGLYNVLQRRSNRSAILNVQVNMKKAFSNILLASLLTPTVTFAQIPQRKLHFLTRLLTLTTAQQQQATTIFTNSTADATV